MPEEAKGKKFFQSRIFASILCALLLFIFFAYGRAYYRDYEINREIVRLQDEVRKLDVKKMESLEILQYVKSDAYAEEKARMELNLSKSGEKVAVIGNGEKFDWNSGQEQQKVVKLKNTSNFVKWWRYFVGDVSKE